jgi:hypothetical protein
MGMTNVTLITNAGRKPGFNVPDSKTLREIYTEHGVNYEACTNTVDSVPIRIGDLDKTLRELGVGESVRLSSIVKMDNAAKIMVVGNAAVVVSDVKLEDWRKALKYEPDLGVYDEETGDQIFGVAIDEEVAGSLNKHGVVFSGTPNAEGKAIATILMDPGIEDKYEAVADTLGAPLLDLNQIESNMAEVLQSAEAHDKEIRDSIVLM